MAVFRPQQNKHVCTLNFDDKFSYTLPLHEDESRRIAKIADKVIQAMKNINPEEEEAFDKAYNLQLDGLDEMLGEGAGAEIMSIYEKPSLLDVVEVVNYISTEYSEAYKNLLQTQKAQGVSPAVKKGRR